LAGDTLNLAVWIFIPVVIQAAAFVAVVVVFLAIRDGFDNILARFRTQ
jgi:hypothetical protein